MAVIQQFEDLEIWKLARQQCQDLYQEFSKGDFSRDRELRNQINSSSGSVMDNIAEGFERSGNKELIHFLLIAKASNGETRSQLFRAVDRAYISPERFETLHSRCTELSKQITGFIKYLKSSDYKGFRFK